MTWRVTLLIFYGLLFILALIVSLSGSLIMNVRPYYLHGDQGMAAVQFFLALGAALFPLAMECDIAWWWKGLGGVLLVVLILVCLGNGIESSALVRGDITASREDKVYAGTSADSQIEQWSTEVKSLKKTSYVPTGDDDLQAAQNRQTIACKLPTSNDCKMAESDLVRIIHDHGLTKRVDAIERKIEDALVERRKLGAPPPDHLKDAAADADFLPINPLKHRPTLIAAGCEGMAALGMIFFTALLNSMFAKAFGRKWWEGGKIESPTESPTLKPEEHLQVNSTAARLSPQKFLDTPKRALCRPGVLEWIKQVATHSGVRGALFSPKQAYPHYHAFCEARGLPSCQLGLFGSILLNECALRHAKKVGGVGYYELNLGPKLALVKAGGELS